MVSPFVDRHHGTERSLIEQLTHFLAQPDTELHLYAQAVNNFSVVSYPARSAGRVIWHKVSRLPGPHILGYVWWLVANHLQRWWDSRIRGLRFDLLYSPGINAFDADAIFIHAIFNELYAKARLLRSSQLSRWPVLLHRLCYYALLRTLERFVYTRRRLALAAPSMHTARSAKRLFALNDISLIRHGVDARAFDPSVRLNRRAAGREQFSFANHEFCLLFIGNDWQTKGLPCLLQSLKLLNDPGMTLLVVGEDRLNDYGGVIRTAGLSDRVRFHKPFSDVMHFYAAADAYVSPSLEDSFGLPILEAMACGLPVIASSRAGASEIIRHGENGMVLQDPSDAQELAALLRELRRQPDTCQRLGAHARATAELYTWERHAQETWQLLKSAAALKQAAATQTKSGGSTTNPAPPAR